MAAQAGFEGPLGLSNWSEDNKDTLHSIMRPSSDEESSSDEDEGYATDVNLTDVEGSGSNKRKKQKHEAARNRASTQEEEIIRCIRFKQSNVVSAVTHDVAKVGELLVAIRVLANTLVAQARRTNRA